MGTLSDIQLKNWILAGAAVSKSDGEGLTFTMSNGQAAEKCGSWVLRYRLPGVRTQKEITIGKYPDTSLAAARKEASKLRARIQQGEDVAREKQREKQERAHAWTVRHLADDYLEKATGRLAPSTISQRRQQLRDHVVSVIGNRLAADVTPADIVDIVEAAAAKSLHVARLVLMVLREMFSHAVARHVVESSPCVHVKAKAVIGQRPVHRTRIMLNEQELRAMLPALPAIGRSNELAVKVLLSTCTRIGELTMAEWSHVDLERREWTIPPELSKNRKRFVIPLTDPVVGWFLDLRTVAFASRFVLPVRTRFRNSDGDRPMEAATLNAALNRLCLALGDKCRRFTPHDLRSTARSHLGAMGVDLLVAERCLNHSLGGLVAVYDQHDYLSERRTALDLWARFIVACETGSDWNVIPLLRAVK
jgi:integrase